MMLDKSNVNQIDHREQNKLELERIEERHEVRHEHLQYHGSRIHYGRYNAMDRKCFKFFVIHTLYLSSA